MSTVSHYTNTGRFNLLSDDRQQQVVLVTPYGTVSELWPEDEAGYTGDMPPDEVLHLIESRVKSYLIKTSRVETLGKIAAIRAHMAEVNVLWYRSMAIQSQKKAARAAADARRYTDMAEDEGEQE